jgi:hypothetical protein
VMENYQRWQRMTPEVRARVRERIQRMSPEERERLRAMPPEERERLRPMPAEERQRLRRERRHEEGSR